MAPSRAISWPSFGQYGADIQALRPAYHFIRNRIFAPTKPPTGEGRYTAATAKLSIRVNRPEFFLLSLSPGSGQRAGMTLVWKPM